MLGASRTWSLVLAAALLGSTACKRKSAEKKAAATIERERKARAAIDVHTHVGPRAIDRALRIAGDHDVRVLVNLSGGYPGGDLERQLAAARAHNGRIVVFANLDWREPRRGPGYGERMAASLERAAELGARGLKIPKGLGLGFVDHRGELIAVDAEELDPVFAAAGALDLPVAIHVGDPVAFWQPPTQANERYAELSVHPGWSLYGQPVPSWEELFAALERRVARHPETTFVSVHFGNAAEYPQRVRALLDRYPNLHIDTAARIPEIGRHDPAAMRKLFVDHADRILFGTDLGVGARPGDLMLGSTGATPPTAADVDHFYAATWRYLETADRDLAHPTPIQGDWSIDGIDLPADVLDKIYRDNAADLLDLDLDLED